MSEGESLAPRSSSNVASATAALATRGHNVGVDVVEVTPPQDANGITSKTAARLLVDLVTAIFDGGQASSS